MSKILKVAIIGVGGISNTHIPGWNASENAEIVAGCDIREDVLNNWGKEHKVTKLTTDPSELFSDPDIDIIDVSATLTGDGTSGDLMFDTTEIADAVTIPAGTGILQSVVAIITDNGTDASGDGANITGSWKLVITSDSTSIGSTSDAIGADASVVTVLDGICCIVNMSYVTDHGYFGVFSKENIVRKVENKAL